MHHHRHRALHGDLHPDSQPVALPLEIREANANADPLQTLVSVVYVTASKTFSGPAVYITKSAHSDSDSDSGSTAATASSQNNAHSIASDGASSAETTNNLKASSAASATPKTTSADINPDTATAVVPLITDAPASASSTQHLVSSSSLVSSSADSSGDASGSANQDSSSTSSSQSSGMSGGAKAGLAIAILFLVGALLTLVLLCCRRKKRENKSRQRLDNEKGASANLGAPTSGTASLGLSTTRSNRSTNAPRLSLRPVTEFLPNLASSAPNSTNGPPTSLAGPNPASKSNAYAPSAARPSPTVSAWERRGELSHANDPNNPFGNHAETIEAPISGKFPNPPVQSSPKSLLPVPGAAVGGAVAERDMKEDLDTPKPLSIKSNKTGNSGVSAMSEPLPSPTVPAASTNTLMHDPVETAPPVAALAAAGTVAAGAAIPALPASNPNGPPSNVHRVQLDFKPSMDDELELRAGSLVRMLHEYDDGWALCIRMDRSQQGVAPRTCLSKHPVKPRPAGPPPTGRLPGPPGQMRGPPFNGPGGRPMSPASGRNSPGPFQGQRAMSPASGRSSPGPFQGQPRPMSPAGVSGRNSPGPLQGHPRPMPPKAGRNSPGPYPGMSPVRDRSASGPFYGPLNGQSPLVPFSAHSRPVAGARARSQSNAATPRLAPSSLIPRPSGQLPLPPQHEVRRRSNSMGQMGLQGHSGLFQSQTTTPTLAPARKPVLGQAI